MKAELDIKPFLKAINEFATAEEQQPCGVQVVERLAYFPSAFNSSPFSFRLFFQDTRVLQPLLHRFKLFPQAGYLTPRNNRKAYASRSQTKTHQPKNKPCRFHAETMH